MRPDAYAPGSAEFHSALSYVTVPLAEYNSALPGFRPDTFLITATVY